MTRLFLDTNIVITRNGKDFSASKLPVMTATEYLSTLKYQGTQRNPLRIMMIVFMVDSYFHAKPH